MKHVSFVILHYLALEDTIECVNSILNNLKYESYSVVIVDNGSSNKSGIKLQDIYAKMNNVKVIILDENLGFAKGNNIGFKYAKYNFKADFIVMINNDTIIEMPNFINEINNIYDEKYFDVLGPDIISTSDDGHQNPQPIRANTKGKVIKQLIRHIVLFIFNLIGIEEIRKKLKERNNKNVSINRNSNYEIAQENIQLHGSCFIFSKKYIDNYEGLYNETFMYFEEDILYYICQRDKLKTLYDPRIKIYHKEDSATDMLLKKSRDKRGFLYKNSIISLFKLYNLMNKEKACKYEGIIR